MERVRSSPTRSGPRPTEKNTHLKMSATKSQPRFDRMMEEARERDELSHELYQDAQYWESLPAKDSKEEKPATTVAQQPK